MILAPSSLRGVFHVTTRFTYKIKKGKEGEMYPAYPNSLGTLRLINLEIIIMSFCSNSVFEKCV